MFYILWTVFELKYYILTVPLMGRNLIVLYKKLALNEVF